MTQDVSKERTRNYLHQIKGAVAYKAVAMLASFLAIPLMIRYLGQEQYGVWSTLLTVMSWIVFFDLGVGNGLRNKVAEALARNDKKEAASYIASGYSLIGLIALALWVLITGASFFVPWQTVFNTHVIHEDTLRLTIQIAFFFVVLNSVTAPLQYFIFACGNFTLPLDGISQPQSNGEFCTKRTISSCTNSD